MARARSIATLVVISQLFMSTSPVAQSVERAPQGLAAWSVDDILLAETASDFQISPDGQWVVWVRSAMDLQKGRSASNLWLTRLSNGESWALTRGDQANRTPRWSPDARYIAFESNRESGDTTDEADRTQLWILRVAGGEPWPLTTDARGLQAFAWKGQSPDTILFAAQERVSQAERTRRDRKDTGFAVEDPAERPPVRLWSLAVSTKRVARITLNNDWIQTVAVSPDGRFAVTRHQVDLSDQFDQRRRPETYLITLASGERRRVLANSGIAPRSVEWAPDGSGFFFSYEFTNHPRYLMASVTRIAWFDLAADSVHPIDLEWERGLGTSSFEVQRDGFVVLLADGVQERAARYTRRRDGWRRTMLEGRHAGYLASLEISGNGQHIAYFTSTANTPPQPFVGRLDGMRIRDERQITDLNPSFATKPKPRVEIIRWPGARDEEVEGVLYYPLEYQEGRPYPLIVSIHGGPTSADLDAWTQRWSYPTILFNQRGAFVLKPNYHGSSNYGLAWAESIGEGRYYELEIPDIEKGVDQLIAGGLVHPDSVATQGWSNGAILSTELTTTNPARYRASSAGAGDVEWISDWGNVDFGAAFDEYYFGTSPLKDPQRYIDKSPFFRMDRVRTPTLIFFGTEDRNVPPSQGWSHFRALQQLGNTDVRFVLFPGEPHGLRKLAHQRRKVEEELAWFDRHLWGRPDTVNPALTADAPLARALSRSTASRVGGLYGGDANGVLVPETVRRGNIDIGRFEVTRGQWREFDAEYTVGDGRENHPASGISFDRAGAYVRWLSDRTGDTYRLPTVAELRGLDSGIVGGGVTLDYWAGYAPNPADVARLLEAAMRLPGDAPLLLEVGSHATDMTPTPPYVFDVRGSVAEWAVAADGTGILVGGSADRPRSGGDGVSEALLAYRGVRVVKEPKGAEP